MWYHCNEFILVFDICAQIQPIMFKILVHSEKYESNNVILNDLEKDPEFRYHYMYDDLRKSTHKYYDKYFPFDDIQILTKNIGHCITR